MKDTSGTCSSTNEKTFKRRGIVLVNRVACGYTHPDATLRRNDFKASSHTSIFLEISSAGYVETKKKIDITFDSPNAPLLDSSARMPVPAKLFLSTGW